MKKRHILIKECAFGLSIQLLVYDGYIIVSIHQIILCLFPSLHVIPISQFMK